MFWCPGCEEAHVVGPSWTFNGDYDRPTFSPSIKVTGKRKITDAEYDRIMAGEKLEIPDMCCHSFIRDGQIEFLGDCTHPLAGQTVALEAFDPETD